MRYRVQHLGFFLHIFPKFICCFLGLLLLDLNIYFGLMNFFSYFDTLSILGLFCFPWGISITFADRVQIRDI